MLAGRGAPPVVDDGNRVAQLREGWAAEVVEDLAVGVALTQPPLVCLTVHGDEHLAELREDAGRRRASADVGAGPAGGRDGAREDELAVVVLAARLLGPGEGRVGRWELHDPLDEGGVRAGAHEPGVGPLAEEQAQAGDDHRLAGPRLAGQHVEPGAQLEQGVVDDAHAADPHLAEHGSTLGAPADSPVGAEVSRR
jgi:hypothetical protein